ncbi:cytochrome P450 family protein [Hazenella coriacea]|uniref:Cytochrome P450 n=1 Tax=Hazenella coriacea TaxID=1179467 RepID=A0A4R3L423_9BACL|nr:cytochrome P450 [Hazenella coriacea]TCS92605.1 cytochrome P450 [Hazenella coriacea]
MSIQTNENQEIPRLDLFSSEFKKNAYPFYEELRMKDPVYHFILPNGQTAWLITRYEDANAVLKDYRFIKDPKKVYESEQLTKLFPNMENRSLFSHMLASDFPDHTRLRNLAHKAFTPKTIEGLRGQIQEITNTLLDKVQDQGKMNLVDDFAFPLPINVICEMLGVPAKDHVLFREWSNALVESSNQPEKVKQFAPQYIAFIQYIKDLVKEKRQNPKDDLVSALIQAEADGDKLTKEELYSMIFLLIVAGHETTVNLISNGVLALLEHPEQMEQLKSNPELIPSAIEEMLRYYGPVELATNRWANEDILLHDKLIRKGEIVVVALASANRDEVQFKEANRFDITRKNNRHIAFGMGIHYCLGAPLARLEGQIAIQTLLSRMPDLSLNVDRHSLEWRPAYLMRSLVELPVVF